MSEKRLTLTAVSTLLVAMLFAYFTWSVNKWTEGVEGSQASATDSVRAHEHRITRLEEASIYTQRSESEIKNSIQRLEMKVDRVFEVLVGEKKDRGAK